MSTNNTPDPEFWGKGWAFPIEWTTGGEEGSKPEAVKITGIDAIKQSIRVIAETSMGERVMRPRYGSGLQEYVFAPNEPSTWNAIRDTVRTALIRFEPRIVVESVEVSAPDGDNWAQLSVHVEYRVRTTNDRFNVVFPFYLNEGEARP